MAVPILGCGGSDDTTAPTGFLAQCFDVADDGSLTGEPTVCRLDETGAIVSRSDVELARGVPYIVDRHSDRIAAVSRAGDIVDVTGDEPVILAEADTASSYAFTSDSELVGLTTDGVVVSVDGDVVAEFDVDGVVDVGSGVDIRDGEIVFTVERPSGGFAAVIGDLSSGELREVASAATFVGQARWSPDGTRLGLVGSDYRSIRIVDRDGQLVETLSPDDAELSSRLVGPRWVDDETIVFVDAVPALLEGDAGSGSVRVTRFYDLDDDPVAVPVLPVPLAP